MDWCAAVWGFAWKSVCVWCVGGGRRGGEGGGVGLKLGGSEK